MTEREVCTVKYQTEVFYDKLNQTEVFDDKLNTNVKKTNVLLAKVCKNNNWSLISNSDINTSSLNASGLHLNDRGAAILAKNYIDFLRK